MPTDLLSKLRALTQKAEDELWPCPICNNSAKIWTDARTIHRHWRAGCTGIAIKAQTRADAVRRWNARPREAALIALVQEAAGELERGRKLAAESRDALDAAIPCIGRDSSSFSTLYSLRQAMEQRDRCELALNPKEPGHD